MRSEGFQKPFFFGGSQTPVSLGLSQSSFSGSGMVPTTSMPKTLRNVVMKKKGLEGKPYMSGGRVYKKKINTGMEHSPYVSEFDRTNAVRNDQQMIRELENEQRINRQINVRNTLNTIEREYREVDDLIISIPFEAYSFTNNNPAYHRNKLFNIYEDIQDFYDGRNVNLNSVLRQLRELRNEVEIFIRTARERISF